LRFELAVGITLFLVLFVNALEEAEEAGLLEFSRSIDSTVSFIRRGEKAGGVLPCGNLNGTKR
jgi:hypothetical protein